MKFVLRIFKREFSGLRLMVHGWVTETAANGGKSTTT